ncbi:unnamed protein product [Urochloa humidicola]
MLAFERRCGESKINRKTEALQSLLQQDVNKIRLCYDEASMVDEAIEYLKQLQLQLQANDMVCIALMNASPLQC